MLTPVVSVAEQIAVRLRGELLSGHYRPGEPLREEQVAQRFGVSRHPVGPVDHDRSGGIQR